MISVGPPTRLQIPSDHIPGDPQPLADLGEAEAFGPKGFGPLQHKRRYRRPAQPLPFPLGALLAGNHPLTDDLALKLSHGGNEVEHEIAGRYGGVEMPIIVGDEINAQVAVLLPL